MKFKTKGEKLAHHHQKEPQCAEDSKILLVLFSKLKSSLGNIVGQLSDDQLAGFKKDLDTLNHNFNARLEDTPDKESFIEIVGPNYI